MVLGLSSEAQLIWSVLSTHTGQNLTILVAAGSILVLKMPISFHRILLLWK